MRADRFFEEVDELPFISLPDLVPEGRGLLVVAPHPDDESLGCGGLIAAACGAGRPVCVVVLSDGVGSHPQSQAFPPAKLRALREAETHAAVSALGLGERSVHFLGLPDRFVPVHGQLADDACGTIRQLAEACGAATVCVTWPHDPHCDHKAAAELVDRAFAGCTNIARFHYPVWGWTLPADAEIGSRPSAVRFDIAPFVPAKAAAIDAHRSQLTNLIDDDPGGFRLMPEMLAHFRKPYELFVRSGVEVG